MSDYGADSPVVKMLKKHIQDGRENAKKQAERVELVGTLNSRLVFLNAAGSIPPELQTIVQTIVTPHEEIPEIVVSNGTGSGAEDRTGTG